MPQRYDLLFVKGRSFIGRAIEDITHSPYCHVAIVLDDQHVAETDWRVPFCIRHNTYLPDTYDVFRYTGELTNAQKDAMDAFIKRMLNTKYDTMQVLSNGLHILFGLPLINDKSRMGCSEAAVRAYEAAGISLADDACTPGELAQSKLLAPI